MRALAVACMVVLPLAGSWAATQYVAGALGDAVELGPPWATVGPAPIYPPWAWIGWAQHDEARAPTVFRRASAMTTLAALAAAAVAATGALRRRPSKPSRAHGSSRWATTAELRKAGLLRDAGVVLCQTDDAAFRTTVDRAGRTRTTAARLGALVRHDGPEHVFCFAPTRSGKGVGLVVPTLLSWPHSVLVYDIKKENWALTAGWRRQFSRTWRFEPTATDSVRFNPLLEIRKGLGEVRDTQNVADILVDPTGEKESRDHWQMTAHTLLCGAILHVLYAEADKTLAGVATFLSDPARTQVQALECMLTTSHLGDRPHPLAAQAAREMLNKSDNERSGVFSTALTCLGLYRDPVVARNTATSDFRITDLMNADAPVSLYLVVPPSDLARTRPIVRLMLNQIGRRLTESIQVIFCATDEHADLVVVLLKEALRAKYGEVDDDAVAKITGATDRPLEAIRRFRNERYPNIAVTVDLLTTGIDVTRIANLVFLRRVRSRILYEQMIGRATRLCPEIGKERFRIFDAVDLYAALKDVTDMKPVVVNPFVTFEQLVREIVEGKVEEDRRESIDELLAKLQRKRRVLQGENEERFQTAAGMGVKELARFLKASGVGEAADYLKAHASLASFLDGAVGAGDYKVVVSDHDDEIRDVARGYGKHGSRRPGDYLEAFRAFVEKNLNAMPALLVVTQRPRDLTREDLRKLKLALDQEGFGEKSVQSAWRDQKNEDIAATIVGYIRQLALGSPLVPYAERVDRAVQRLRRAHRFTDPQSKWLDRIAKQVKLETVVDRASLDAGQFKADGGFARLNKVFDGKLEGLLGELADEVWKDAG